MHKNVVQTAHHCVPWFAEAEGSSSSTSTTAAPSIPCKRSARQKTLAVRGSTGSSAPQTRMTPSISCDRDFTVCAGGGRALSRQRRSSTTQTRTTNSRCNATHCLFRRRTRCPQRHRSSATQTMTAALRLPTVRLPRGPGGQARRLGGRRQPAASGGGCGGCGGGWRACGWRGRRRCRG